MFCKMDAMHTHDLIHMELNLNSINGHVIYLSLIVWRVLISSKSKHNKSKISHG